MWTCPLLRPTNANHATAASKTAKWVRECGSIDTEVIGSDIIGQIQLAKVQDFQKFETNLNAKKEELIRTANEEVAFGMVRRGGGGANYQKTEMYVTYAPPFLTELSFTILADVVNSDQYMKLAYTKEFEIKENLKADVSAGLGYMSLGTSGQSDSFHGLADSPFGAGISWNGFRFGLEATYRHSYDIYDSQVDGDPRTSRALYIDGGSTAGDGLVADPSRTKGFGNQLVNSLITSRVRAMTNNTSYTYTPRQKVPRWLYAVNVSYSTSL
jgi:hypothetical protein